MFPVMQLPKNRIEEATRKWWFYVAFILLQGVAFVPFASRNFSFSNSIEIVEYSLGYPFIGSINKAIFPLFKVIPMVLIALIFIIKN